MARCAVVVVVVAVVAAAVAVTITITIFRCVACVYLLSIGLFVVVFFVLLVFVTGEVFNAKVTNIVDFLFDSHATSKHKVVVNPIYICSHLHFSFSIHTDTFSYARTFSACVCVCARECAIPFLFVNGLSCIGKRQFR